MPPQSEFTMPPGYVGRIKNYTPPNRPSFVDIFKGKDDEDYVKKTMIMLKTTGWSTLFTSVSDIVLYSDPQTIAAGLYRVLYWGVPIIGGGLAYTATNTTLASLRNKSDQWNHFWSGVAAGSISGAARKSVFFGIMVGLGLGITGVLYKDSVMHGYEILPDIDFTKSRRGHPFYHKMDYSTVFTANRPGWWARSDEEAKKMMEERDWDYNNWVRISQ